MPIQKVLIPPLANAFLERELRARLRHVSDPSGPLEPLELLAVQVGLIQNRVEPHLSNARLIIFASDHGLVVDSVAGTETRSTAATVECLVTEQLPLASLARLQGLSLMVVDSGIAEAVESHEHVHARKIAHGTRNPRHGKAMSIEQVHAAIRAGIELGESLDGNVVEYCVHTRSNHHRGLNRALSLFDASVGVSVDMDAIDGTGATLVWPLISAAASLLSAPR